MQPRLHGQALSKDCHAEGVCSPVSAGLQRPAHYQRRGPSKALKRVPCHPLQLVLVLNRSATPMCSDTAGYFCCNNCPLQGSQDARKAKLYGKLGKLIVQAVKAGGPNQETNPLLKEALRQAHQAQLPKDVVDRNMKKASDKSQADFREVGPALEQRHLLPVLAVAVLCADAACRAVLVFCTGCFSEQWGAEQARRAEVEH